MRYFFIFLLLIIISKTIFAEREYEILGYDRYFKRINKLNSEMISGLKRYENKADMFITEVKKRSCVNDRLIVLKSLINSAENEIVIYKNNFNSFVNKSSFDLDFKKESFLGLMKFYKTYSRFRALLLDIDSCILKYDDTSLKDGELIVEYYKK